MEKLTITVKNRKTKKVVEKLAPLEESTMVKMGKDITKPKKAIIDPKKVDLSWLDPKQRRHAREILQALRLAQLADQGKIKLKSAQEFLNEIGD
jgi:hypothetical protein